MNLIFYEAKSCLKSTGIWIVSLISVFALMMIGAYPIYSSAIDDIMPLLANYPPEFIEAFGMDLENLFSYGGFYNFSFGYIGLVAAIMAASLSISVFSREKRSKCMDFLLTKPISRENIFFYKLVACLGIIVLTNIFYVGFALLSYNLSGDKSVSFSESALAFSGVFFTQILFLSLGIAFAVFAKRVRSVSGSATIFGFGAFVLSAISNIIDEENIEIIAPLKYFEPNSIFTTGGYSVLLIVIAVIIIALCLGAAFVKFCKDDARAG